MNTAGVFTYLALSFILAYQDHTQVDGKTYLVKMGGNDDTEVDNAEKLSEATTNKPELLKQKDEEEEEVVIDCATAENRTLCNKKCEGEGWEGCTEEERRQWCWEGRCQAIPVMINKETMAWR
eukprot:TRINITY_DN38268_c0_g1_i1.p1 TRINITY_DN38268_c0_g1~~TRINITY_DN38268_c0_g1_i1.p1  ORF type:complete len:123 (-),score=31.97 TRINITY_DN38268_c0_g1_i1:57-425(-)